MKHEASTIEAIWICEKLEISRAKYTDLRLMPLDRFVLPPVYKVSAKAQEMLPSLEPYKNGVRAQVGDCLLELSSVNIRTPWGVRGSD